MKIRLPLRLLLAASLGVPLAVADSKTSLITAVHSKVLNGYKRAKNKDGTFKREFFALSDGGHVPGTLFDASLEKPSFPQLASVLGQLLARENYHLAKDSKSADLLLVVYRGRTIPHQQTGYSIAISEYTNVFLDEKSLVLGAMLDEFRSGRDVDLSSAERITNARAVMADEFTKMHMMNRMRDQANEANAQLLGYIDDINRSDDPRRYSAGADALNDLIADLEEPRYYLFVFAYDFREIVERKNRKLLWATRVSIRAAGSAFDRDFAAMLAKAARHFGQDSGGLLRRYDPRGRVDIGEIEIVGMTPHPSAKSEK